MQVIREKKRAVWGTAASVMSRKVEGCPSAFHSVIGVGLRLLVPCARLASSENARQFKP